MRYKEEQTQVACVCWFGLQYPEYALLLHHSPNGGYRTAYEGKAFKRMGTRAGFPDLILLLPRGEHPFLCIEFKTDKGRQTESQKAYQRAVESVGAVYAVCRSFDEFKTTIERYINFGPVTSIQQKPVEWSEEDENVRKRVVGLLEGWLYTFTDTCYAEDCKCGIAWLKSLKRRMEGE